MKKKDWPKNMEQSKKRKEYELDSFFQFRDDCESKRVLTNFFACNEGLGDLHHQRHHHCSFSASTDFSALTSFFPPGCCDPLWNFETEGKGRLKSWNGCRYRGRDCSGMSVIPSFSRSNLGWWFETRWSK